MWHFRQLYTLSLFYQPTNTRDTREWGTGYGRVAEGLPVPVPVHTRPATRPGLPDP